MSKKGVFLQVELKQYGENRMFYRVCTSVFPQAGTSAWVREIDLRLNRHHGLNCDEVLVINFLRRRKRRRRRNLKNNNNMKYERVQVYGESIGNHNVFYNVRNIAKQCPHCKTQIYPKLICMDGDEPIGYSIFCRCPNCNKQFICKCDRKVNREIIFVLSDILPNAQPDKRNFSDDIQEISESFCEIYNQAYAAQQLNLTQICGVGYRKALEYLIKDYIITEKPDYKETILKKALGTCIREDIDSENIKNVASRATWLGNDETHYIRKWEDKDITDLVNTINLTLHWIEAEVQTKKLLAQMPEGR